MKANLHSEEMVVLKLSISLFSFVDVSILHVTVMVIIETETGLPRDLPYFNLKCSLNVSGSTNTHADVREEIFSRELCIVLSLSIAVVCCQPISNCSAMF